MRNLYRDALTAEHDIKSILGAQLMASTPQDLAILETMIKGILNDWDSSELGIPFFIHVMASKMEQFYAQAAMGMGRNPIELFQDDGRNGFAPEGLKQDGE